MFSLWQCLRPIYVSCLNYIKIALLISENKDLKFVNDAHFLNIFFLLLSLDN